jgi:hypothetical protein
MGINLVVAVTNNDWFEMLRKHPSLAEVNFWAPSAANFRALQPGELFLFKLHAPRNAIVGGGISWLNKGMVVDEMACGRRLECEPVRLPCRSRARGC